MKNKLSFQEFSYKLDLMDINFLLSCKEEGVNWSLSKVTNIEKWYRRFLYLYYLYPETIIVPTKEIDIYWHHHIMDTEKYYDDCQLLFGRILHHYPYLGTKGPEDELLLKVLFEETNILYDRHFSERPSKKSGNPTACGGGGSNCAGRCGGKTNHKLLVSNSTIIG